MLIFKATKTKEEAVKDSNKVSGMDNIYRPFDLIINDWLQISVIITNFDLSLNFDIISAIC